VVINKKEVNVDKKFFEKEMAWVKIVVAKLTHAMLINPLKIIQIFSAMDDFIKSVEKFLNGKALGSYSPHAVNEPGITLSEMMCIEVLYHLSGYKCFQYYYQQAVEQGALRSYFPSTPSYNRFVQLKLRILPLVILFLNSCRLGRLCGSTMLIEPVLQFAITEGYVATKCSMEKLHGARLQQGGFMDLGCFW